MEPITVADLDTIRAQIGRPPRGVERVRHRCSYGYPQVIQVHPLIEGKPFPTLYWLTCPFLQRAVSRLEAEGWIGRLERYMAAHPSLTTEMDHAHRAYIAERFSALSEEERRDLRGMNRETSLSSRGIGGIRERRTLKCLHLHVAHALATENPIGRAVLAMLPRIECSSKQVICSALLRAEQID